MNSSTASHSTPSGGPVQIRGPRSLLTGFLTVAQSCLLLSGCGGADTGVSDEGNEPAPSAAQAAPLLSTAQAGAPPSFLLGEFEDDYGVRYTIDAELWQQGHAARYLIERWDSEGRYAIARNHAENPGEPGLFTRIDWVELTPEQGGGDYPWAFCYAVFDAEGVEQAVAATSTDRDAPRTGCGGFPFSRMRLIAPGAD